MSFLFKRVYMRHGMARFIVKSFIAKKGHKNILEGRYHRLCFHKSTS